VIRNNDFRDLAVFTIVQDEPEFIHPWVNHYKNNVADHCDIYVLVHPPVGLNGLLMRPDEMPEWKQAEPLLTEHHGVVKLPVHHFSAFDHQWLSETVSRFQAFLLQSYDWVLFAEIDEFILPTPRIQSRPTTLLEYVRGLGPNPPPAVRATGFEVIQQDYEAPICPSIYNSGSNFDLTAGKLLRARGWWRRSERYSKTLLAGVPMRWAAGFHAVEGNASEISIAPPFDSLTLIHLHKVDFGLSLTRLKRTRSRNWSEFDVVNRMGWQNRIGDTAGLRAFWGYDDDTGKPLPADLLLPIPDEIKQALC
jgi:hypothetical protein